MCYFRAASQYYQCHRTTRLGEEVDDIGSDNVSTDEEFEVKSIQGKRCENSRIEYLVRWKKYNHEHGSWEPAYNLEHAKAHIARLEKDNK